MNILCFFHLHFYKDKVLYDYLSATQESIPCTFYEECKWCGKIRKEIKGFWSLEGKNENGN